LKKKLFKERRYANDDRVIDLQRVNAQLIDYSLTFNDQASICLRNIRHHENKEQNHREQKPGLRRRGESRRTVCQWRGGRWRRRASAIDNRSFLDTDPTSGVIARRGNGDCQGLGSAAAAGIAVPVGAPRRRVATQQQRRAAIGNETQTALAVTTQRGDALDCESVVLVTSNFLSISSSSSSPIEAYSPRPQISAVGVCHWHWRLLQANACG
jgi:hypothetical protein